MCCPRIPKLKPPAFALHHPPHKVDHPPKTSAADLAAQILKIFQDINTGSVNHSIQQSRRAVYWGPYIDMLEELAYLKEFMLIRNPDNPRVDNKLERDR